MFIHTCFTIHVLKFRSDWHNHCKYSMCSLLFNSAWNCPVQLAKFIKIKSTPFTTVYQLNFFTLYTEWPGSSSVQAVSKYTHYTHTKLQIHPLGSEIYFYIKQNKANYVTVASVPAHWKKKQRIKDSETYLGDTSVELLVLCNQWVAQCAVTFPSSGETEDTHRAHRLHTGPQTMCSALYWKTTALKVNLWWGGW